MVTYHMMRVSMVTYHMMRVSMVTHHMMHACFQDLYGLTETYFITSPVPGTNHLKPWSVGSAFPNVEVKVQDFKVVTLSKNGILEDIFLNLKYL